MVDDIALDTHPHHGGWAALGRMGHLSRQAIGFLPHGLVTRVAYEEDRPGICSGLSACFFLCKESRQ